MDMFTTVMGIVSKGVIGVGALLVVWHGIKAASAFSDHNGPGIKEGLWGVGSGVIVGLLGAVLTQVTF